MSRPIVILTALDLEYDAVKAHLTETSVRSHRRGTRFELGRTPGGCRVVLGLVGKGNNSAAVLAERAMAEFDPLAVIFCGIAGRLWPDIALGDVVVATHVYHYHGGTSEDDGFKTRPRVWPISHACDQIAHHLARSGEWARRDTAPEPAPTVRFGPVAAGETVLDSTTSAVARLIRNVYNDALAVEMEAGGLAEAAHANGSLPAVVVRGISDRADGTKTQTDGKKWRLKAAANAALFTVALAEEINKEQKTMNGDRDPRANEQAVRGVRNIAQGNAHVGVQTGIFHGDVSIGGGGFQRTADAGELLGELRAQLRKAQEAGEIDEETCAAAEQEIDVVAGDLPPADDAARSRVTLALRKLRGLLLDWTDLATRVTALIAAVRGLS